MNAINQLPLFTGVFSSYHFPFCTLITGSLPIERAFFFLLMVFLLNHQSHAFDNADDLWPIIEKQMAGADTSTDHQLVFLLVRGHCGNNYQCLYPSYAVMREKLERRFDLPAAIAVCNEMVRLASKQGDKEGEAHAHKQLFRFYDALGDDRMALVSLDKAQQLFEQIGNQKAIAQIKVSQLENEVQHSGIGEVLPKLEALLDEVTARKDTASMNLLHLRLILYAQSAGEFELMAQHVAYVEKIPLSDPIKKEEYGIAIYAALGRADLFRINGDLDSAEIFYQKALRLCEAEPSRWLEIKTLQQLAEVEWERGNWEVAENHINKALGKAEKLKLDDLLTSCFEVKAKMAEEEGRYAEALGFTKLKLYHEEKFESKSAGFSAESYFLEKEKKQLAAEKERQANELQIKGTREKKLLVAIVLSLTLATAFGIRSYFRQPTLNGLLFEKAGLSAAGGQEKSDISTSSVPIAALPAMALPWVQSAGWQEHLDDKMPQPAGGQPPLSPEDQEWLAQLEGQVRSGLAKFDFNLEELADLMFVSRRQLGRQVKDLTGLTPSEYLLEARLQFAQQLLDNQEVRSVKQLAYSVGLRDAKHFSKKYKKRFGKPPSKLLEAVV